MVEGRAENFGRCMAKAINQFSSFEFQEAVKKPSYIRTIIKIMDVPFEKRKKGTKSPKQNKSVLKGIPYDKFHIAWCKMLTEER